MYVKYFTIILCLSLITLSNHNTNQTYHVHTVHLQNSDLRMFWKNDSGAIIGDFLSLKKCLEQNGKELKFAVNGGMFHPGYVPVGLYVEEGKLIRNLDTGSGSGNFYLKPNGVFYITQSGRAGVCETSEYVSAGVRFATQSGPLLLNESKIHPVFRPESASLNIRNGVGVLNDSTLVFVQSLKKVNFYQFAQYFKTLKCTSALYLDGAISETYHPESGMQNAHGRFGVMIAELE